jgi:hypothetical protein
MITTVVFVTNLHLTRKRHGGAKRTQRPDPGAPSEPFVLLTNDVVLAGYGEVVRVVRHDH